MCVVCFLRLIFCVALYGQYWHWNVTPSWTDCICIFRLYLYVALYSQLLQGNILPSCFDFMCLLRMLFWVALYSQCWHWNIIWSCYAYSNYNFDLNYSCNKSIEISFLQLHALTVCVFSNYSFELLCSHRRNTAVCHFYHCFWTAFMYSDFTFLFKYL